MKRKTGGVVVSLLLAGMITLNMFPISDRHAMATDIKPQTETTGILAINPTESSDKDRSKEENTEKETSGEEVSKEEIKVLVDTEKLQRYIQENFQCQYSETTEYTKKFSNTKHNMIFFYDKTHPNEKEITNIKISGYFSDNRGNKDGNVSVNKKGEAIAKRFVITDIRFHNGKDFFSAGDFFKTETNGNTIISYDISSIKDCIYDSSDEVFSTKKKYNYSAIIEPCPVVCTLQEEKVTFYKGQPEPVLLPGTQDKAPSISKGQWKYYYTMDNSLVDADNVQFKFDREHNVQVSFKEDTDQNIKNNFKLFLQNNADPPAKVTYEVLPYTVPNNSKPTVVSYSCTKENDGNYSCIVTLKAPDGFELSQTDGDAAEWGQNVSLQMDDDNSADYFVRRVDEKYKKTYLAVSEKQTYQAVQQLTAKTTLKGLNTGNAWITNIFQKISNIFYTNMNLKVSTLLTYSFPTKGQLKYDIFFTRIGENGKEETVQETKTIDFNKSEWNPDDKGKYFLEKSFDLSLENGRICQYVMLEVEIPNFKRITAIALNDTDRNQYNNKQNGTTEKVNILVDKQPPVCEFSMKPDSNNTVYKINVQDEVGIQRIEYWWDDLSYNNKENKWVKTDPKSKPNTQLYYQLNKKQADTTKLLTESAFELDVRNINRSYSVPDGKHTLHIRVTDVSGNVCETSFTPEKGIDTAAPVLTRALLVRLENGRIAEDKNGRLALDEEGNIKNILLSMDKDGNIQKGAAWENDIQDHILYYHDSVGLLIQAEDGDSDTSDKTNVSVSFGDEKQSEPQYTIQRSGDQEEHWYSFILNNGEKYTLEAPFIVTLKDEVSNTKEYTSLFGADTILLENDVPVVEEIHLINEDNQLVDQDIASIHTFDKQSYYHKPLRLIVKANDPDVNGLVSGIKRVYWKYGDNENSVLSTDETITFRDTTWYVFTLSEKTNYQFKVWAVDNSGNRSETKTHENIENLYWENENPEVESIEILKIIKTEQPADPELPDGQETTETVSYELLKEFTKEEIKDGIFVGYYREPVRVRIRTNDGKDGSGIRFVKMDHASELKQERQMVDIQTDEGTAKQEIVCYVIDLDVGAKHKMTFEVTDRAGNVWNNNQPDKDLLDLESLLLENDAPSVTVEMPRDESEQEYESEQEHESKDEFYGLGVKDHQAIKISLTDEQDGTTVCSGVDSFEIKDEYENSKRTLKEAGKDEKDEKDGYILNIKENGIWEIFVPMSMFVQQDGLHTLRIKVKDKSGNYSTKTKKFFIDYTQPVRSWKDSALLAASPKAKSIENQLWFDGKDAISIKASFTELNIDRIELTINGRETTSVTFRSSDKSYPINFDKKQKLNMISFTLDNDDLPVDQDNKYQITVQAIDRAGNTSEKDTLTLYRDFDIPVINKIVVDKLDDNTAVNILRRTFGVFAKGDVMLRITASDTDTHAHDSGIEKVTIAYTDLDQKTDGSQPEKSGYPVYTVGNHNNKWIESDPLYCYYDKKNNRYSYICILSAETFKKHLRVMVYDKFGKSVSNLNTDNEISPAIEGTSSDFIFLESKKPTVIFTVPKNKAYVDKDTGKIWYNDNQKIRLFVQDGGSGIRYIKIKINGKELDPETIKDINGSPLLTESITRNNDKAIIGQNKYELWTDDLVKWSGKERDGKYEITVIAVDNAGNKEEKSCSFNLDTKAPVIGTFTFNPSSRYGENESDDHTKPSEDLVRYDPDYGFYFLEDFDITVDISDAVPSSGLNKFYYKLVWYNKELDLTKGWTNMMIKNGKGYIHVEANFKGQIYVKADDHIGNICVPVTPEAFVIDSAEKHQTDAPHIKMRMEMEASYQDANGNSLYTENVTLTVILSDTISGIHSFTSHMTSEKTNEKEKPYAFNNNKTYKAGEELADGWKVTKTERNLVTEMQKTFIFSQDDNDIQVTCHMTDRAGNKDTLLSNVFTIDKKVPIISVNFAGDEQYYSDKREASILITERNFDEQRIAVTIKNSLDGKTNHIPSIRFTPVSNKNDQYQATFTFEEGDYTFDISGTDRGNHAATVNYTTSKQNAQKFYVDARNPVFGGFDAAFSDGQLYNTDQTMTLRVTEHNFSADRMNVTVTKNDSVVSLGGNWSSNGDDHTMIIDFKEDGIYQVAVSGTDKANRALTRVLSGRFEIDKTPPEIIVSFSNQNVGDEGCFKDTRNASITVSEKNFDPEQITLHYTKNRNDTSVMMKDKFTSQENEHTASVTFDEGDYQLTAQRNNQGRTEETYRNYSVYGKDKAGNIAVVTYSGNNYTDFHVDATPPVFEGFDAAFNDGQLYNTDQTMMLRVTEHNFSADRMTVSVTKNDGASSNRTNWISNGDEHTMTIDFKEDGIYQVAVSGTDKANIALESSVSGKFEIDKTAPTAVTSTETIILTSSDAKDTVPITFKDVNKNITSVSGKVNGFVLSEETESERMLTNQMNETYSDDIKMNNNQAGTGEMSVNPYDYFSKGEINQEEVVQQGIYEFSLTAVDKINNTSDTFKKSYVVLDGDFVAYIPAEQCATYKEKINSDTLMNNLDSTDNDKRLTLDVYARKDVRFKLMAIANKEEVCLFSNTEEENIQKHDCISETNEQVPIAENGKPNGEYCTHYHLEFAGTLAGVLSDLEEANQKKLNIISYQNNEESAVQTLITFDMDDIRPDGKIEVKLFDVAKNPMFDGYYGDLPMKIKIQNIPDDLDWEKCVFFDNKQELEKGEDKDVFIEDGKIVVTVRQEGEHVFEFILIDKVGNIKTVSTPSNAVYFGSVFGHLWPWFLVSGLLITAGLIWLIVFLIKRKKT